MAEGDVPPLISAKIHLSELAPEDGKDLRASTDKKKWQRIVRIFELQGCEDGKPEHRVPALVRKDELQSVLARSGFANEVPVQPPKLTFGHALYFLRGHHRLVAAAEYLAAEEQWWTVDLYDQDVISSAQLQRLRKKFDNAAAPNDGEFYWNIIECRENDDTDGEKEEFAKWTQSKSRDFQQLQNRKVLRDLNAKLKMLRPFKGLWPGFRLGAFRRAITMRFYEEACALLDMTYEDWSEILGNESYKNLDPFSVSCLAGRSPMHSIEDRTYIISLMVSGQLFCNIKEAQRRRLLLGRILHRPGIIRTLHTTIEDFKFLEPLSFVLRELFEPKKKESIRKAAERQYRSPSQFQIPLQESESQIIAVAVPGADRIQNFSFWTAYCTVCLFAFREYPSMTSISPRKDPMSTARIRRKHKELCRVKLARLALKVGFYSSKIENDAEGNLERFVAADMLLDDKAQDSHESYFENEIERIEKLFPNTSFRRAPNDVPEMTSNTSESWRLDHRCGRTFDQPFCRDLDFYFFRHIFGPREIYPRERLTSFAVIRFTFHAFLGTVEQFPALDVAAIFSRPTSQEQQMSDTANCESRQHPSIAVDISSQGALDFWGQLPSNTQFTSTVSEPRTPNASRRKSQIRIKKRRQPLRPPQQPPPLSQPSPQPPPSQPLPSQQQLLPVQPLGDQQSYQNTKNEVSLTANNSKPQDPHASELQLVERDDVPMDHVTPEELLNNNDDDDIVRGGRIEMDSSAKVLSELSNRASIWESQHSQLVPQLAIPELPSPLPVILQPAILKPPASEPLSSPPPQPHVLQLPASQAQPSQPQSPSEHSDMEVGHLTPDELFDDDPNDWIAVGGNMFIKRAPLVEASPNRASVWESQSQPVPPLAISEPAALQPPDPPAPQPPAPQPPAAQRPPASQPLAPQPPDPPAPQPPAASRPPASQPLAPQPPDPPAPQPPAPQPPAASRPPASQPSAPQPLAASRPPASQPSAPQPPNPPAPQPPAPQPPAASRPPASQQPPARQPPAAPRPPASQPLAPQPPNPPAPQPPAPQPPAASRPPASQPPASQQPVSEPPASQPLAQPSLRRPLETPWEISINGEHDKTEEFDDKLINGGRRRALRTRAKYQIVEANADKPEPYLWNIEDPKKDIQYLSSKGRNQGHFAERFGKLRQQCPDSMPFCILDEPSQTYIFIAPTNNAQEHWQGLMRGYAKKNYHVWSVDFEKMNLVSLPWAAFETLPATPQFIVRKDANKTVSNKLDYGTGPHTPSTLTMPLWFNENHEWCILGEENVPQGFFEL